MYRLDALGPNTYAAFQASNDLRDVVQRARKSGKLDRQLSIKASLMTPVKPMLVCVMYHCACCSVVCSVYYCIVLCITVSTLYSM